MPLDNIDKALERWAIKAPHFEICSAIGRVFVRQFANDCSYRLEPILPFRLHYLAYEEKTCPRRVVAIDLDAHAGIRDFIYDTRVLLTRLLNRNSSSTG